MAKGELAVVATLAICSIYMRVEGKWDTKGERREQAATDE